MDQRLPGARMKGEWEVNCLMGIEFLFGVMIKLWKHKVVMVAHTVNILNATK